MCAGFFMVVLLMVPVTVAAQEAVSADGPVALIPEALGGEPMPAPVTVRFWNYRDVVAEPYCADLPAAEAVALFTKTFTTNATTSYIELILTGQFTVPSGVNNNEGIYFQIQMIQDGVPVSYFPGAGDDLPPLMTRRDDVGAGQQMFSGYRGIIVAQPDLETTITVRAYSSQKNGLACYQNLSLRYD
jgi:hypothetical protein